jgi:hypothetical protein
MAKARDFSRLVLLTVIFASSAVVHAQFPEQNVNMVSGTQIPGGDPYLRQQNEVSVAVAKDRNVLHLLAAANDYRSVDIPFNASPRPDDEDTGDAWIGIFRSKDGGNTWTSTLLDGYPQQANSTSPLKGFQAAADPVVRAGNNGMFYVAGIVLNRGNNPLGGLFVSRFIDNNNTEVGDPIAYIDTKMIDTGTAGQFIDKPWLFVTQNPNGGQCTVNGQTFPAQTIYVAYSVFVGNDNNIRTMIMFAKSTNCGATWDPIKLSEMFTINQGATIVVDGSNVYVIWRRFHGGNDPDSIIMAKSTNGGATFAKGTVVTNITPFEQGTTTTAVRTNAYPTAAIDDNGRLHIAWSELDANGDGRIMLITSTDGGTTWSAPRQVDQSPDRGHQFMPTMIFNAGKLSLVWYDLRLDHTVGTYTKSLNFPGFYDESRVKVGNLALGQPEVVFWNHLADQSPTTTSPKLVRRHTLEVYVAEGDPAAPNLSFKTVRVTRYKRGSAPNQTTIQDLQINPPNLPMFRQGTVPFIGDYIDITAYLHGNAGAAPVSSVPSRVRHVVWTDNRDVRPPLGNPPDWTKYTPVKSPALGQTSFFDPNQKPPDCTTDQFGNAQFAASRNQNVYTTRVTDGLFAGSPGNAKPLGKIKRAFTAFLQNARNTTAAYRLTIAQQPSGGTASFLQFDLLDHLDVTVPPHSTATRTVFVTGAPHTRVDVNVREINMAGPGGTEVPGGLSSQISLNQDPQNPDIGNPDIGNPDIGNAEVFNPDIGNPDIGNPDIGNPDIGNPDIGNPDIGNPDIGNPDIGNPDIGNPDIGNPDIGNPDIGNPDIGNADLQNGSATDTSWQAQNQGNTTGGFTVKLLKNADFPPGVKSQLILNKIYDTPVARGCNLGIEHNRQVVANINNPTLSSVADLLGLTNSGLTDSSEKNATMWLAPHEIGRITVRLVDPFHKGVTLDASAFVTPVVIAQSVNTQDAGVEGGSPKISLTITTMSLPDAVVGQQYSKALEAIGGVGARTWNATGLPAGLTLNGATGVISGAPQAAGTSSVTITVTDSATPPHARSKTLTLRVFDPLVITNESLPNGTVGQAYNATLNATGGLAPRTFSIDSGSLPAGLSLGSNGAITGTPTTAGTSTVTFAVTDSASPKQTAKKTFSIRIDDKSIFVDFVVQPTTTTSGATMTPAPVVRVRDSTGAVLAGVQVTLNLGANPGNASFPTQTAITDAQGLAQFAQIVISNQAAGYTLVATASPVGFSAGSATSVAFDITSAIPGTVAAGFGQLVVIPIPPDSGFPAPSNWGAQNLKVTFLQGAASPRGFAFASPSSSNYLFARLPFQGDNVENGTLSPGNARVHVTWDTGSLPDVPIGVSTTPGKPVIRFAVELNAPPVDSDPCGSGFVSESPASNPITTVTPGQGIGISAFGTDTTNAVAVFKQGTPS